MKRIVFIILAIVCGATIIDSFAKKPKKVELTEEEMRATLDSLEAARKAEIERLKLDSLISNTYETGPYRPLERPIIPCSEKSYDTMNEIRGMGIGEGKTAEEAKSNARQAAIDHIKSKIPAQVSMSMHTSKTGEKTTIIEKVYNDSDFPRSFTVLCYEVTAQFNGLYKAYIVLSAERDRKENEELLKAIRNEPLDSVKKEILIKQFLEKLEQDTIKQTENAEKP